MNEMLCEGEKGRRYSNSDAMLDIRREGGKRHAVADMLMPVLKQWSRHCDAVSTRMRPKEKRMTHSRLWQYMASGNKHIFTGQFACSYEILEVDGTLHINVVAAINSRF
ncbi:hypothetical protein Tcan_01908 [Toxocara canis]|uniref:Uncharacterized protein n=1 Tax=Toxocara canis TaxID=6265 RepID=A0A0B2V5X2_TOXCA|nr:hypothetical protein Tcan_01908 [Toxocara canis]